MKTSAKTAGDYVDLLQGWRLDCVQYLRENVKAAAKLGEELKWGHLVYLSNGPVLLIRAEQERVLFGFWRGKRLREIEPALKASGKYEMASLEIRAEPYPSSRVVKKTGPRGGQAKRNARKPTRRCQKVTAYYLTRNKDRQRYRGRCHAPAQEL